MLCPDLIRTYATTVTVGVTDLHAFIESALLAFAFIAIIFGILNILVAYGFWIGAGWSRMLAIVLLIIYIIGGILLLPYGIIPIIIARVLLWYLWRPYVKVFFGAAQPAQAAPPVPPA